MFNYTIFLWQKEIVTEEELSANIFWEKGEEDDAKSKGTNTGGADWKAAG